MPVPPFPIKGWTQFEVTRAANGPIITSLVDPQTGDPVRVTNGKLDVNANVVFPPSITVNQGNPNGGSPWPVTFTTPVSVDTLLYRKVWGRIKYSVDNAWSGQSAAFNPNRPDKLPGWFTVSVIRTPAFNDTATSYTITISSTTENPLIDFIYQSLYRVYEYMVIELSGLGAINSTIWVFRRNWTNYLFNSYTPGFSLSLVVQRPYAVQTSDLKNWNLTNNLNGLLEGQYDGFSTEETFNSLDGWSQVQTQQCIITRVDELNQGSALPYDLVLKVNSSGSGTVTPLFFVGRNASGVYSKIPLSDLIVLSEVEPQKEFQRVKVEDGVVRNINKTMDVVKRYNFTISEINSGVLFVEKNSGGPGVGFGNIVPQQVYALGVDNNTDADLIFAFDRPGTATFTDTAYDYRVPAGAREILPYKVNSRKVRFKRLGPIAASGQGVNITYLR
jgi:hypothetical protein